MPLVKFPDSAGQDLTLMHYGNKRYMGIPIIPQEVPENVHNIEMREDDIILISYPKSGCHWLWEMARMIRAGTSDVGTVEKETHMMEFSPRSSLHELPSPRTFNTHLYFEQLPPKVQEGKVKLIFLYRNPKDVAVSFYNHHCGLPFYNYKGKFGDYLPNLFMKGHVNFGDIFTYTRDWEAVMDSRPDLPIFTVSYEALQADTVARVKDLAAFLGCSVDDDTVQQIVDRCSFGSMKERKGQKRTDESGQSVFYRKGKVGDWKTWFTVAQNEMMDSVCQDRMKGSRFQFQYTP